MSPDKVRAMVAAMQAAGEDDDAIRAALTLAKSKETKPPPDSIAARPMVMRDPSEAEIRRGTGRQRAAENARRLEAMGGPQVLYTDPHQKYLEDTEELDAAHGDLYEGANAMASKFMNGATFGGANRMRRLAMGEQAGRAQEAHEEQIANGNPVTQVAGGVSGLAGGGIATGPMGTGLAGMIEQKIPALANNTLGRVVTNAAVGTGVGATAGAAEAGFDKGAAAMPGGAWRGGAAGGLFGAGLGVLAEGAGAVNNAVQNSAGGQARQRLEARGANVGPLDSGSGGVFDNELAGLKPNDRGIGQASRRGAAGALNKLEDDFYQNVGKPHGENRTRIAESPEGQEKVDVTPIYSELVKLWRSRRLTPGEHGQVESIIRTLEDADGNPQTLLSQVDLNDFRGMLQDMSKTGSPANPTVAQSKMQKVAHATKEMVDQGPYAETNKAYSEGREAYEGKRQLLDLPAKPTSSLDPAREAPEGGREPEVAKLANMLARDEQNTVTAGVRNSDRIAQFIEQNPEYADMLTLPRVLEDKANLGFRISDPKHGGLLNRLKHEGAPAAVLYMLTEFAGGNRKLAAGVAAGTHLLRTNAQPIAGRLLYGPAGGAADMTRAAASGVRQSPVNPGAAPGGPVVLPGFLPEIEQAYADWQRRQQEQR